MSHTSEIRWAADPPRYNFLKGPNGLRAGWRLLIFYAILLPTGYGTYRIVDGAINRLHADYNSPLIAIVSTAALDLVVLLVSSIMGKMEGRTLGDYGLPWRRAFCKQFWQGAAVSLVSLATLLFALRLAGALSFSSLALHGAYIWKYAASWAVMFFLVALLEDSVYRGYLLFTLTAGIGFWPAAVVTSLWMGGMHFLNPGGHGLGPVITTVYCLVTCLVIRRTGDLWMPLGIHAAWDWAIIFVGVPSGGQMEKHHLFNTQLHGPTWLTGGTYGPEASWPNLVLLITWGIFFSLWLHGVKYPNPAAVQVRVSNER
ncbi:MAG: lysostaphin resistance A-like protein [Candidatus Sulfotelmatobacter sp.]